MYMKRETYVLLNLAARNDWNWAASGQSATEKTNAQIGLPGSGSAAASLRVDFQHRQLGPDGLAISRGVIQHFTR